MDDMETNKQLLEQLADDWGYEDVMDMLENNTLDSVVPGICTTSGCEYSCECEPDARENWCENCEAPTVKSCLVLAGVI